jgi:deaminated glutathione amidase
MKLRIATCQFATTANITKNCNAILRQMKVAAGKHARVVHFLEGALSGYAGHDFTTFKDYPWEELKNCTYLIMESARKLKIWVILGSAHRLSGKHKPHNCLYIIGSDGAIKDRYDKMFCTGDASQNWADLKHYSPGNHFCVFTIDGVRCGALICHDFRYQELYREYYKRGVKLMFHSFYNVLDKAPKKPEDGWAYIVRPTLQAYAANNYMWISATNCSRKFSSWPAFVVRPDGIVVGNLRTNMSGILIREIDTKIKLGDASVNWRDRSIRGIFHSGKVVPDRRSDERTKL